MSGYKEPEWAQPCSVPMKSTVITDSSISSNIMRASSLTLDTGNCTQRLLSVLCIGLVVFMSWLGVVAILNYFGNGGNDISDYPEIFIALYMLVFSVLLFCYELMWWMNIDSLNKVLRKNFGFFYSITGKAMYLIFIACLCLGLDTKLTSNQKWLKWTTGFSWLGTGLLFLVLRYFHPDLLKTYQNSSVSLGKTYKEENENIPV